MEKLNLNQLGQSAQSFDPMALAKMKADTINGTPGNYTGYDCSKCKNRGNIAIPRDDGGVFFRECDCMSIRRCVWKMEKSGLKNVIRDCTFDAFDAVEPWQKTIKAGAQKYAANPEGWFLMCGQSGSGKTHLCVAVCRDRLLAGDTVVYSSWRDDIARLKALSLDAEQRDKLMMELKTAPILYVDDLFKTGRAADGSSNPTGADVSLAFEIVNYRYVNRLPTLVSTEKTPEELMAIDEATGSRIIELAGTNVFNIGRNTKRNYRLRGVVAV